MNKFMVLTVLMLTALSGCGTIYEPDPVGTGYDINELKLSPCACMQVMNLA